ncbi:MAG: redoxin domain-containing protein [Acidimicrobiales bacterium]
MTSLMRGRQESPPADGDAGPRASPAGRPIRRRWWLVAGALCVAVVAGLVAYAVTPKSTTSATGVGGTGHRVVIQGGHGPGAGLPKLAAGINAPDFSLARLGGGSPVTLGAERGHPVVLNFFASWCTDCRAELRAFAKVSNGPHGAVKFLAVDTNDHDTAKALSLLQKAGDHYPTGVDSQATVANSRYYVEALPVTVFINAKGRIVGQAFGAQTVASLRPWVRALEKVHHSAPGGTAS